MADDINADGGRAISLTCDVSDQGQTQSAVKAAIEHLGHVQIDTIHVVARRSAGFYVAESLELALVTQGRSLDELLRNIRQAVRLHLEGENPAEFGLSASPRIAVIYEESLSGDAEA